LLVSGCARPAPTVSGTIRFDGEPLAKGSITFFPVDGTVAPGGGGVVKEGSYKIEKGLTPGKYRVDIQVVKKTAKNVLNPIMPAGLIREEVAAIPPEYNVKSRLIREIHSGDNPIDFELETGKVRK
jgi:hypothetical protein